MPIESPTFPLTKEAFNSALQRGHGRALQHIAGWGALGVEDLIVEACVSCLAYDPQCEADRAPWLFSVVAHAKLNERVIHAIAMANQDIALSNHRDLDQRSELLKEFALAGSTDARRLLYSSLLRLPDTSADVIAAAQIVALDGMDGLMRVARQCGRWLQADPDFWVDGSHIGEFDGSIGIPGGLAALEREAEIDHDIASYLEGVRKTQEQCVPSSTHAKRMELSGADVVTMIRGNPKDPCHWLRGWGRHASSEQRDVVYSALLDSSEPEQVKRLFKCFSIVGTPRFDPRLLRWIDHADEQVQWSAVRALAPFKHTEIRQTALRTMSEGQLENGIALLVNNFETGDMALCAGHLHPLDDADIAHGLVGSLLGLCEAHLSAEALDCLLYVYEFSPCSTCRKKAVKLMVNAGITPTWVMEEAKFDGDPETQALAQSASSPL
jgi:hypothetical protein